MGLRITKPSLISFLMFSPASAQHATNTNQSQTRIGMGVAPHREPMQTTAYASNSQTPLPGPAPMPSRCTYLSSPDRCQRPRWGPACSQQMRGRGTESNGSGHIIPFPQTPRPCDLIPPCPSPIAPNPQPCTSTYQTLRLPHFSTLAASLQGQRTHKPTHQSLSLARPNEKTHEGTHDGLPGAACWNATMLSQ